MRLSIAIMAHVSRARYADALRSAIDMPVRIVLDEEPASSAPAQRWRNGRDAWGRYDSYADYHIVLQDDTVLGPLFLPRVERALEVLGESGLMSLFTGVPRIDQVKMREAIAEARRVGGPWCSARSLNWGVAIAAPVSTIDEMLAWSDQREDWNYDVRIGRFYRDILGWRTWYPIPSLVGHRNNIPSLVGNRHDATPIELAGRKRMRWSNTPEGFHHLIDPSMERFAL